MIDTHIHVWNFDKAEYSWLNNDTSILKRNYNLEEIEEERKALDITKGVLVQAAVNLDDTNYMLEVAQDYEWIKGVVAWLPLPDTDSCEKIISSQYIHQPIIKGIRHLIHDEPNNRWLVQPQVLQSLQLIADYNYTYDIVGILPEHIECALKVAETCPSLKMVFDHLNHPPINTNNSFGRWGELMKAAAQHKNFYVKISGLGTVTGKPNTWTTEHIQPYIEFVLEQFGEDRCFCGGDWPVSMLAGTYTYTWNRYKEVLSKLLQPSALKKVLDDNANSFYRL